MSIIQLSILAGYWKKVADSITNNKMQVDATITGSAVPLAVSGAVAVNNHPTAIAVNNFPATQNVQVTGSNAEQASAQDTQVVTTVKTYARAVGASRIELYCESGYVRVRTDGQPCTSTTGEPVAPGFGAAWDVDSISVYYIQESVITVVSR